MTLFIVGILLAIIGIGVTRGLPPDSAQARTGIGLVVLGGGCILIAGVPYLTANF